MLKSNKIGYLVIDSNQPPASCMFQFYGVKTTKQAIDSYFKEIRKRDTPILIRTSVRADDGDIRVTKLILSENGSEKETGTPKWFRQI